MSSLNFPSFFGGAASLVACWVGSDVLVLLLRMLRVRRMIDGRHDICVLEWPGRSRAGCRYVRDDAKRRRALCRVLGWVRSRNSASLPAVDVRRGDRRDSASMSVILLGVVGVGCIQVADEVLTFTVLL